MKDNINDIDQQHQKSSRLAARSPKLPLELIAWLLALIALFFLPETTNQTSLCVFSLLGLGHCPGCGIGHAIHYALRLEFGLSWAHHPLGIFAVIVIFRRIKQLVYPAKPNYATQPTPHDPRH